MSETHAIPPFAETLAKPEALMRVPMGLASPLWGLFAGAAIGGSAWWWMTRWARPQNLEAMFGAAAEAAPSLAAPAEAVIEAAVEAETAVEAAEAVEAVEAVIESPVLAAPVGGEAAPIAPALAAAEPEPAAPKPRAKKVEPKPE